MNTFSWRTETVKSATSAQLHTYSSAPQNPKAIVQINHGMAEHAGRYERFAETLYNAGFGVYAHDHRGHGKTTASDASLGLFANKDGWSKVLQDVGDINEHLRAAYPNTPIICFGHSMGSIIAYNFALRNAEKIQGLALWNAGVDAGLLAKLYGTILRTERFFKGSDVPSGIAKKLTFDTWNKTFAPNRTDYDWLSRDEAEVDKYVNDPMCGFEVTIGLWLDVLDGINFAALDANMRDLNKNFPIHLLAGDKDPCTENGKSVANIDYRMRKFGMTNVTFELLKDTRHESLNELNRDETTLQFIAWLNTQFTA